MRGVSSEQAQYAQSCTRTPSCARTHSAVHCRMHWHTCAPILAGVRVPGVPDARLDAIAAAPAVVKRIACLRRGRAVLRNRPVHFLFSFTFNTLIPNAEPHVFRRKLSSYRT